MRRCPTCGTPVGDTDKHCNRCGRSLGDVLVGPGSGAGDEPVVGQPAAGDAPTPAGPPPPDPFGAAQGAPYGQPGQPGAIPGIGFPVSVPNHPSAQTAMILGILAFVVCGIFTGLPAMIIGAKAKREIDASGGAMGGRGMAQAGFILGLINTVVTGLVVLLFVVALILGSTTASSTT